METYIKHMEMDFFMETYIKHANILPHARFNLTTNQHEQTTHL